MSHIDEAQFSLRSYGDRSDFPKIVVGPEFSESSEFAHFGEPLNACVARTKPSEKFQDIFSHFSYNWTGSTL